jgi:hypothetical protein
MVVWAVSGIFGSETVPNFDTDPQFRGNNNNYQRFVARGGGTLINWRTAGFDDIIGRVLTARWWCRWYS